MVVLSYVLSEASQIASMTHWHDHSTLAVRLYCEAVNELVNADESAGVDWAKELVERRMSGLRKLCGGSEVTPSGYVIDSAICATNVIRDTSNFDSALVYAVNLGGDADTIGAITGGLAGAIYGSGEIPLRWLNALNNAPNGGSPGNNLLLRRLIDFAQIAYVVRTGEQMSAVQAKEELKKIF